MAKRKDRKSATGGRESNGGFYARALSEAERVLIAEAMEVEGLNEEIALLRVKLSTALAENPENMPLMLRAVELLVKAVGAEYRLSKKSQDNLAAAIDGVLKELGGALLSDP